MSLKCVHSCVGSIVFSLEYAMHYKHDVSMVLKGCLMGVLKSVKGV